jgi:hypothetical protein
VRLRPDAVVLASLLACGAPARADVPANAPAHPAASPAPIGAFFSREEIHAAAAKLRADPNLGGEKKIRSLRWTDRQTPQRAVNVPSWLSGLFEFLGQSTSVLLWVAGAVSAAVAAIWIIRTLRTRMPSGAAELPPRVARVGDMDISPESLPEDIGAAALALLEAGRTRDALSLLYRGALSRAVHRHGVLIGESYTEGEALKAVRAKLDPSRADYFADLVGVWQRAVYAGEAVLPEPIARLCRSFVPALEGAAA